MQNIPRLVLQASLADLFLGGRKRNGMIFVSETNSLWNGASLWVIVNKAGGHSGPCPRCPHP